MPNNWKTYNIGDVATLQRGFDLPNSKRKNGAFPVIAASGFISWHNVFKVKGPGVTTGRSGSLGQVFYVEKDFWPLNTSLWVKDFHNNEPRFIYYFLKTINFEEFNSGTSVPTLNRNDVHSLEVNIPDLPEQKAIASILSAIDDKIENNLAINKTLEDMVRALYKHWFEDFGPFKDSEFIDSELGRIPNGWEVKSIKELGKVVCGKTPSKKKSEYYSSSIYPFIKIPDMHGNVWVLNTNEGLSEEGNNSQLNKLLPSGSINVSCIATVGLVSMNIYRSHTNQQINSIIPENDEHRYFIYLSMINLKETFLNEASGGSATLNMNTSTFSNIDLIKPNEEVLLEFHKAVIHSFEQIKNNQIENQTLTHLRDTLLPKLISGEVRLKEFREQMETLL
ncbi:MAG: restriction endonuclease subunit S [Flavobacteriaceae bacterium]